MKTFICLALCIVLIHCSIRPSPVKIPEVTNVYDKPWYSGYLDIPFEHYKAHVHYFYFPSQSATPEKDPVLFWFNGGPGCSSLLGALYEHGPFVFIDAFGSLVNNPEAWNKRAHTIYIESPAQVGFSYMDIEQGDTYPIWDDEKTSNLNLAAVLNFFETFPEFQNRPTYLSGQSYAGIYVPTLAYKIHRYNTEYRNTINLQGFAVGNGCTDRTECEFINDYPRYQIQLFNDLGILPDSDYDQIQKLCSTDVLTDECKHKMDVINNMTAGINIYDAYRPCWQNNAPAMSFTDMLKQAHGIRLESQDQSNGWAPPCVDSEGIDKLLENPNNRKLLGIPNHVAPYAMCNNEKTFNYTRSTTGSYWVYEKLIPLNKYKIVKYSGDSDPAVPFSGTLMWINKLRKQLRLTTITYWKPWKVKISNGEQNSGSLWEFSNKFSLFRFKGVGHMAPQWNNQGGTKLINYVLFDEQP